MSDTPRPPKKRKRARPVGEGGDAQPRRAKTVKTVKTGAKRNRRKPRPPGGAEVDGQGAQGAAPAKRSSRSKGKTAKARPARTRLAKKGVAETGPKRNRRTKPLDANLAPADDPEELRSRPGLRSRRAAMVERLQERRAAVKERATAIALKAKRPAILIGKTVLLAACVAGAIAVGRLIETHVRTSPAFAVRTIEINGNERMELEEVTTISGLELGQNVFDMSPEDVRARLVRHPWIATAEVQRRLPGTYLIEVRERTAVAVLALDRLYLVGEDGAVFKQVGEDDSVDLPVITGISRNRFVRDEAYRARVLVEIVGLMHDYRGAGLWAREPIGEVRVEEDDSVSLYIGDDATLIRLGRAPFRQKLRKLRRVFDRLAQRDSRPAYVYLDNQRRPDRVTVRLREPYREPPPAPEPVAEAAPDAPAAAAAP